jgi:hypothetical protein
MSIESRSRSTYLVFNNHFRGFATQNAAMMTRVMSGEKADGSVSSERI